MSPKRRSEESRFTFTLFKRSTKSGGSVLYARIIDSKTGTILAQRSTGTSDERMAAAEAGKLLAELPLAAMSQGEGRQPSRRFRAEAERLRDMMASRFFTQFWEDGSTYLAARDDAGKSASPECTSSISGPPSSDSLRQYPLFQRTPLRALTLLIMEGFRDLPPYQGRLSEHPQRRPQLASVPNILGSEARPHRRVLQLFRYRTSEDHVP
ncbi:hypothetical protein MASR2M78_09830 [Treponema sp.]